MNYKLLLAVESSGERASLCCSLNEYFQNQITILEAGSGCEALNIFFKEAPAIAILDIEMQDITGLEVAEKIRKASRTCALLFLASSDNFSYAKQAIVLRALDFLLKPYEEKKLIQSVREAIQYTSHFGSTAWERKPHQYVAEIHQESDPEGTRLSLVREDIRSFIEAHFMEELSMKNAAHAMNYSDAYFCKLFKQCFHVNFSTYLNEYRIETAKHMMENPRTSIKDISTACGYTDSNYFSRVFKRITGLTPTEYRLSIMEKSLQN